MGKLRFLTLSSWNQLCKVFLEETTELDHDNEQFFTCRSILNDKALQSLVVFNNWIALLLRALSRAARTSEKPKPLLSEFITKFRHNEHCREYFNTGNQILEFDPHSTHLVVVA
jgi:hypothetical protein